MIKIENVKLEKEENGVSTVYAEITAPDVWWHDYETATSDFRGPTDTTELPFVLHFIYKDFTMDDFVRSNLDTVVAERIKSLNELRKKFLAVKDEDKNGMPERLSIVRHAEHICPSTYIACNRVTLTYDEISEIYDCKCYSPLEEWEAFFDWVKTLPDSEALIFNKGE